MKVRGIESMTLGELVNQVKLGGRFVVFHWCVGLLFKTVHRPSAVYFVQPGERAAWKGFWQTLGTLLTGWWSVRGGPRNAIGCLRENLAGGRDITASVLRTLVRAESERTSRKPIAQPLTSHAA